MREHGAKAETMGQRTKVESEALWLEVETGNPGDWKSTTLQEVHYTARSRLRMSQGTDRNQRWWAGELAGFGRGSGNGRLGGISVDFELDSSGDTGNSELDGTSGEGRLRGITSSNSSKIFWPGISHSQGWECGRGFHPSQQIPPELPRGWAELSACIPGQTCPWAQAPGWGMAQMGLLARCPRQALTPAPCLWWAQASYRPAR